MAMSPSTTTLQQPAPPAARPVPEDGSAARTVASAELLRGGRTVEISHNGLVYRLQATKLGKLILTK
jgi:hemin uptake protein HemP